MIGAIITFLVLLGLIKIFERGRDDLDNFQVGMVAVVPILAMVITQVVLGLLYPQPMLIVALPPLVLIGFTYFLLYKNLEIPMGRSITYTAAVVIVNLVMAVVFVSR